MILTSADAKALSYWRELASKSGVRVFSLDASKATESDAIEIKRLDRFHPVLVFKDDQPLGMWIENDHPAKSRVAYNVEFLEGADILDFQRKRFDAFKLLFKRLTDSEKKSAHLTALHREIGAPSKSLSQVA